MGLDGRTQQREVALDRVAIAARSRSQSAVLPSMSVKRKVTVPRGRSTIIRLPTGLPQVRSR